MRLLRNTFINRSISIFLLIVFIQPIFSPYYTFALTSGPHQPEFTSYEDAGSTDMVNLLTGDFGFNIPILDVPGPEGNFSLPLSYHAGIGPEQEASWVGLGWNINTGAILRNINQYPDDAKGEEKYITVKDLTGVNGWSRTFNHPFKDDWNSQTGYHGNVNLLDIVEVDFGNETSVGIVGVHVGDNGVTFDAVQFVNAAMTILSYGTASGATSVGAIAKQAAIDMAVSTAISFAMPINTPGAPAGGNWKYSKSSSTSYKNHWKLSLATSFLFMGALPIFSKKKSWKMWLDQTSTEDMYGVLYMGAETLSTTGLPVMINNGSILNCKSYTSSSNTSGPNIGPEGVATDINFSSLIPGTYTQQAPATVLALDDYTVNAAGISGSIKPHRLEVGSVGMPRSSASSYARYSVLPFLNDYKVPFLYEGSLSNQYFYHVGNNSSTPSTFNYGMQFSTMGSWRYKLDDIVFGGNERIRSDINTNGRKLPQVNNIQWNRNADLDQNVWLLGHVDFASHQASTGTSDRYKFRNNLMSTFTRTFATSMSSFSKTIPVNDRSFLNRLTVGDAIKLQLILSSSITPVTFSCLVTAKSDLDVTVNSASSMTPYLNTAQNILLTCEVPVVDTQNAIGAYNITSADGTTFHFALPVYGYDERSESVLKSDNNKRFINTRYVPFANSWLLTAITGSDFVDRNNNGIADEGDWGYWVKMNYGKYADSYAWRIPYTGTMDDLTGTYMGYEKGQKQLYYLNSIETRSHVALFLKSNRGDGMDAYKFTPPQKLDEICLLKKEHYEKLKQPPYSIPNYSNTILTNCLSTQFTGATREFVNKNCLKRVIFNYSYDLCKNTPNTLTTLNSTQGKLTLTGLSIKGRNDIKVVPDYKFEYSNNPNYGSNYWDGWGMYNPGGTTSPSSHTTNDASGSNGSAWSMTKVTTPLGSEMLINYERDTYASISGETILGNSISYGNENINYTYPFDLPIKKLYINHNNNFVVGDKVNISGSADYKCPNSASYVNKQYSTNNCIVTSIGSGFITVAEDYMGLGTGICSGSSTGSGINFQSQSGLVTKILFNKPGGNIRTGSIVMRDEFGKENKLRYLYKDANGNSTGVVSQEPDYIRPTTLTPNFNFYDYLRYPQTPVMYGAVSVLSGKLTTDNDFYSKQLFEFVTPHTSQFSYQSTDQGSASGYTKKLFTIEDRTSMIGKLKSIQIRNATDNIVSQSQLIYSDVMLNEGINNRQGVFSEGTLLTDNATDANGFSWKVIRTTVVKHPYALKKITNIKDGFSSTTENLSWDLLTGIPDQRLDKSSLGIYIKTVSKPAYKVYPELGSSAFNSKVTNPSIVRKNMLSQNAATYVYRSDALGNSLGLINAEAQTWRNDWSNYRKHNGTEYAEEGTQTDKIWRKGAAYSWKGSYDRLQPEYGTQSFTAADEFNFSGANPKWQYLGESIRFDHYGMPLESVDMNGPNNTKSIYTSVKMGYDDRMIVARASNAKYSEIAFSSAEDKIANIPYFGGEVGLGVNGTIVEGGHTGNSALNVAASGYGFVFKSTELSTTKAYKISVWMLSSGTGSIYYKSNGVDVVPQSQTMSEPVLVNGNNWQRIDLTFIPPTSTLEIGVKTSRTFGVFDDFRFQPADAVMTCNVYAPLNYEFTATSPTSSFSYVLDNDNLFTKYEVNEKGELIKVYKESIQYGVKLISESKNNLRRFNVNQ